MKFLTGLLAGVAIGILFAPDKGSETRKKISKLVDDATNKLDSVAGKVRSAVDEVKESVDDLRGKGAPKMSDEPSGSSFGRGNSGFR